MAADASGVAFVEIDAADRMDLTRRLRVMSTPTVLVLGPDGAIERRSSGQQRKSDLLAAVGAVLGEDARLLNFPLNQVTIALRVGRTVRSPPVEG